MPRAVLRNRSMEETSLGKIYTADEGAKLLRLTRRAIIKLGRRYGLCSVFGRHVTFSGSQLLAIREVTRVEPQARIPVVAPVRWKERSVFDEMRVASIQKAALRNAKKEIRAAERKRREEQKANARRSKAEAKAKPADLEPVQEPVAQEKLDYGNRDPAYWTDERKLRLKREREERIRSLRGGTDD